MADRIKNLLIGIFVTTASGIIIFMLMFLHPFIGDEGQTLHVLFTDIEKVNIGSRVLFAGRPVGEVIAIYEVEDATVHRTAVKGDVYAYELVLAVDSSVKVYNSDKFYLRTAGLLGEKSVAIDPEPLAPGEKLRLIGKDEVIYSEQVGSVEDTFKEFKEVADRLDVTLDKVNLALDTLQEGKTWENVAIAVKNGREIAENVNQITGNIKNGKGSLGKILSSDDLYLRMTSMLSKGETIFDDVNHYGVLFHLDKGWQRLRARRMNLLEKLATPQEFRNYFNDEVNQIQTSLARVSMVVDKSSQLDCLIENPEFTKVYAELMRRVTALEEELRMYNNQLNQCQVYKTELLVE